MDRELLEAQLFMLGFRPNGRQDQYSSREKAIDIEVNYDTSSTNMWVAITYILMDGSCHYLRKDGNWGIWFLVYEHTLATLLEAVEEKIKWHTLN